MNTPKLTDKQVEGRQPPAKSMRRKMFTLICYAYIFLGLCCIASGCALYAMPFYMGSQHPVGGLLIGVLIGFGLLRIGTAVVNLRRLN